MIYHAQRSAMVCWQYNLTNTPRIITFIHFINITYNHLQLTWSSGQYASTYTFKDQFHMSQKLIQAAIIIDSLVSPCSCQTVDLKVLSQVQVITGEQTNLNWCLNDCVTAAQPQHYWFRPSR
ncbi:Hypothetical_protein [Hexamita inflata]|uniref:Hypothetical_protein n=1 Tax=Hexamita inflata TaxID=28002 RepID=A0ABP1HVH1_9EUKA